MLGMDMETPLTPEQTREAIDSVARKIVGRRLETPALLLLEMNKPLSFIASQGVLVALPLIGPLIGAERVMGLSKLLQDRANIDTLISRIGELADERDAPPTRTAETQG